MLRSMAITQSQIDALDDAIASGELRVTYDGRTVEYRSIKDLKVARQHLAQQLDMSSRGAKPRTHPRYQVARFSD